MTLSERNLDTLIRMREKGVCPALHRMTENGYLSVAIENDEAHYGTRTPGIGPDDIQ